MRSVRPQYVYSESYPDQGARSHCQSLLHTFVILGYTRRTAAEQRLSLYAPVILTPLFRSNQRSMCTEESSGPESPDQCPSCGEPLTPGAVLCVGCGYHLTLGRHLSTVVEHPEEAASNPVPSSDPNPYAAPTVSERDQQSLSGEPPVFDLTEEGARRAASIVSAAQSVLLAVSLAWCLCAPAWLLLLPWYTSQLLGWYQMRSQFIELRNPNAFSPHGELVVKFQDAWLRLLIGVIVGCAMCMIIVITLIIGLFG